MPSGRHNVISTGSPIIYEATIRPATMRNCFDELGLSQSLGRTGICYDNAAAESFFATLKKELVYRTVYPTREKAMRDIARYIELRYNRKRLHSANGYRPPQEVRNEFLALQVAA